MLPQQVQLSSQDFARIRSMLYRAAGIALGDGKQALVAGRLHRRLDAVGVTTYAGYIDHIEAPGHATELQFAIDLLTTNETYFWREPQNFDLLTEQAREAGRARRPFSVWSAASSSGEEAYTLAMLLEQVAEAERGLSWRIVGSDISTRVLERARTGHYPMDRAAQLPPELLRRYCLKGQGQHEGSLLVTSKLRERVSFQQVNLIEAMPAIGPFDAIFLRNVLIYFDAETKARVLESVASRLVPGGRLFVGLSESVRSLPAGLLQDRPAVYRRPARQAQAVAS